MKYTTLLQLAFLIAVCPFSTFAQETKDYSLGKVANKIQGVYVFIENEPYYSYDYIATVKGDIKWRGDLHEELYRVVKKAKKKYPNFNGMIVHKSDWAKIDLIRFHGLDVIRGGLKIGGKVQFTDFGKYTFGEIIEFKKGSKKRVRIKYINIFGEQKVETKPFNKLTPISDESYKYQRLEFLKEIKKYRFASGNRVSFILSIAGINKKAYSGVVVSVDRKSHKASVKYKNSEGEEKVANVSVLKLTRIE